MVTVTIEEDSQGRLSSFVATGHAGWADKGNDVVCAAVSALLQAAWLGLTEVAKVKVDGARSEGELRLRWPEEVRDRADVKAIVETAQRSIETIALQYPDHVQTERGHQST